MKKIILIILILALISGGYYFFSRDTVEEMSMEEELLDYQLNLSREKDFYFSDLSLAEFPEVNLGEGLDSRSFSFGFDGIEEVGDFDIPEVSTGEMDFDFSFPEMEMTMPQPDSGETEGTPPSSWTPNASDCARFASAPSCDFVDSEYRDMCEACEKAGF